MLVGVPKEIKVHEYRVGLTPSSVREMVANGHAVLVQTDAGAGIGASDDDYRRAGAEIAPSADDVYARAEMIVKVKEPQAIERAMLREGQIQEAIVRISELENQGDALYSTVIADLFRADSGRNAMDTMKWKEIYQNLEDACDSCKDFTHIIGNVVIKNA